MLFIVYILSIYWLHIYLLLIKYRTMVEHQNIADIDLEIGMWSYLKFLLSFAVYREVFSVYKYFEVD